jgi:hypothetical protein
VADIQNPSDCIQTQTATTDRLLTKTRIKALASGLVGMVLGGFVGIGVQVGVQSTGLLGPSVEELISEQELNFKDIKDHLGSISRSATDPDVRKNLSDLSRLLERQDELNKQASGELSYLSGQLAELKQRQLTESGYAGGADFWLKSGESVTVGSKDQVFSLIAARNTFADVNLSGKRKRLTIGDGLQLPDDSGGCKIFYKQAKARPDGRVGFDLSCG